MKKYPCPKCGKALAKSGITPGKKPRWICRLAGSDRVYCYSTTNPDAPARDQRSAPTKTAKPAVFKRELEPTKRYIVTAAQNATPVHKEFWASLIQASKHLDAEILVIPLRYKNPTSRWTQSQENAETWNASVTPYLWNVRRSLNANLLLLADVKTQPTASEPLRGYEAMSMGESAILGHTKLQMKVIPTPSHKYPKIMTTTGACTVANYTDTRAGKLGEFHHTLGAVLVEIQGKAFHLRHLNANKSTGEFTDLGTTYSPTKIRRAERPLAIIMGDTHVDYIDPKVEAATFGLNGMVTLLKPQFLVWHDLLDSYAVNPHHHHNPYAKVAKYITGKDSIKKEIKRAVGFVNDRTPADCESIIVSSNHDDFVRRYMMMQDWREDPANAQFYLKTALHMVENLTIDGSGMHMPNPFAFWFKWLSPAISSAKIRVLKGDESFTKGGVELGMHGDRGPSGARGSRMNLRRIGVRSVIGHSHSPGIDEGCYQVGTSTGLKLEYTNGPSAWLNTHCILHADGKRQLVSIIDGNWRI